MTPPDADVTVSTKGNPPVTTIEVVPVRGLFKTKTAFAQYVVAAAGLASAFYPPALDLVKDHATAILLTIPVINLVIRKFTHGKVALIADSPDGM